MDTITAPSVDQVEATLEFLVRTGERPVSYAYEPPPGTRTSDSDYVPRPVAIRNARPAADRIGLDREGFQLVRHRSAVTDFWDDAQIRHLYYPEAEQLLKAATGAGRVLVFDHTLRRRLTGVRDRTPGAPRQPARRVHVDQTERSGPQRVRDLLPQEAEALLRHRVAIVNVWRPIRAPLLDQPLALCDAASVDPIDLVPSALIYRDRVGETYAVAYNAEQRWYYVPAMQADEVLLIKCYDSDRTKARFAPHTSFQDPTTPSGAPPRESIELRALLFFPPSVH